MRQALYRSINRAADQIEQHPHTYNFMSSEFPDKSGPYGTSTCLIGWIRHFMGEELTAEEMAQVVGHRSWGMSGQPLAISEVSQLLMQGAINSDTGGAFADFCTRLTRLVAGQRRILWTQGNDVAAKALRLLAADLYPECVGHAPPARTIPDAVTDESRGWVHRLVTSLRRTAVVHAEVV